MEQLEEGYSSLEAAERGQADLEASQQIPPALAKFFDFSEGWVYTDAWVEEREQARNARDGGFLWDAMMDDVEIDGPATYPPTSVLDLKALINSLHSVPISRLYRDGFLYYLLLDLSVDASGSETSTGRKKAETFAKARYLPQSQRQLLQGYWELDRGLWESATSRLADPSVQPAYVPLILRTLSNVAQPPSSGAKLTTQFITWRHTLLDTSELRVLWLLGLCDSDFVTAWNWVRNEEFLEALRAEMFQEVGESLDGDAVEEASEKERYRLLEVVLDFCFIPQPRSEPLEMLLTLPIDDFEHSFMTSYLLRPSRVLPASSFDLLHDLLTLRLLSQGHHAAAIDLDRRVTELDRQSDQTIFSAAAKRKRKDMVQDMIDVLPQVQKKLLVVERDARENESGPSNGIAINGHRHVTEDLGMSWDIVDQSPRASSSQLIQPQPIRHIPLSASTALRSSATPNIAIYQALVQHNPASPVPQRLSPAVHAGSARGSAPPASPFGSVLHPDPASPVAHLGGSRVAASGTSLYRQMANSQMKSQLHNGAAAIDRPSSRNAADRVPSRAGSAFRDVLPAKIPEVKIPKATPSTKRMRPLGGWSVSKETAVAGGDTDAETPRLRSRKPSTVGSLNQPETEQAVEETIPEEEMDLDHPVFPGSFGYPPTSDITRKASTNATKKKPARKQRQASTQPESPPPTRKAPARTRKATSEVTEDAVLIPGSFPKFKARAAPPSDEEPVAGKKPAKRPRAPPAAPSSAVARKTRAQSVASSEGGEEMGTGMGLRRSSRLSSIAPSSPSMSERSELPAGKKAGSRQGSVGPRKTGGVRTRRQTSIVGDED